MKIATICLCLALFAGCAAPQPQFVPQAAVRANAPAEVADPRSPEDIAFDEAVREITSVLDSEGCTPRQAVEAYLELQYLSYISLQPVDLGAALDLYFHNMHNLDVWQDHLVQRRRLLHEMNLCYVEREKFPYTVRYLQPEEVSDGRLEFWDGWDFKDDADIMLHFVVEGESGKAYPPLLAIGGEQTVRLRREDGRWKIIFIYFPGASRKFYIQEYLDSREDNEVRAELLAEFMGEDDEPGEESSVLSQELRGRTYNAELAADYAMDYALLQNPDFYHAGDWAGNCMNFVSQSVMHGFGDGRVPIPIPEYFDFMTGDWYAGDGGGAPAWENVNHFWAFATRPNGPMTGQILSGAVELIPGDVVQTQSRHRDDDDDADDFTHALIVVDDKTMMLAQNSPSSFAYYSDLVDVNIRLYRPLTLSNG